MDDFGADVGAGFDVHVGLATAEVVGDYQKFIQTDSVIRRLLWPEAALLSIVKSFRCQSASC